MVDMDKIVSLCKRRGFIFQSSEIYGGRGWPACALAKEKRSFGGWPLRAEAESQLVSTSFVGNQTGRLATPLARK